MFDPLSHCFDFVLGELIRYGLIPDMQVVVIESILEPPCQRLAGSPALNLCAYLVLCVCYVDSGFAQIDFVQFGDYLRQVV
jgi:hypothetical protein